jgi:hypothetical protein
MLDAFGKVDPLLFPALRVSQKPVGKLSGKGKTGEQLPTFSEMFCPVSAISS